MKNLQLNALASAALLLLASAPVSALIGYPIPMYKPSCAYGCRAAIASLPLDCTDPHADHGSSHGSHGPATPECRSKNKPFLTTLAWCIDSRCPDDVESWRLERYWAIAATGDKKLAPVWGLTETLAMVEDKPEKVAVKGETLNYTALVDDAAYNAQKNTLEHFEFSQIMHSRADIALITISFGIPILFSAIYFLPFGAHLTAAAKPYLIRSSIGKNHVEPIPSLDMQPPTIGQGLYIFMFLALNVILSAVGYQSTQPNTWFVSGTYEEILAYISARTGGLAFAAAPLVILLAGRNNILLYLTNWSHSTYLLLHRWVARIFTLQVIVHSITELALYIMQGTYEEELVQEYWIWGCVATVAASAMMIFSASWIRRKAYEFFLISHILLAVFVIVGSWYHIEFLFTRKWGYEFWIYAACAVWFFDRLVRVGKVLKNGVRRAEVREISEDVIRVDIKDLRWNATPGRHAYIFFPTLIKWRPWENHPFSIMPTALLHPASSASTISTEVKDSSNSTSDTSSSSTPSLSADPEKVLPAATKTELPAPTTITTTTATPTTPAPQTTAGITFFLRKAKGQTARLTNASSLLTLLDGPYTAHNHHPLLKSDRLLLIAGGIGITAVLPFAPSHPNVKLLWSVRSTDSALIEELRLAVEKISDREVRVGGRFELESAIDAEAEKGRWLGVLVCGPAGMADEVRDVCARIGRGGRRVEVVVEAFSW